MRWGVFLGAQGMWAMSLTVSAMLGADKTISFVTAAFVGLLWAICYLAGEKK